MIRSKKRAIGVFTLVAAPLLVFASAAFACQRLTTARLSQSSGPAGTQVTVSGGNYAANRPVEVRWDSRTARPLVTATANGSGVVQASITIPNSTPGYHTVLITQTVNGVPAPGTPGRASFNVTASSASAASTGLDPSVLVTPVGLAGLLLMVAVSRRPRRRAESAA